MAEVYVADDDDWEYNQDGNLVPVATEAEEYEEDGDWGEGDEGEGLVSWEGAGPSKVKVVAVKPRVELSDVPDEAYWDESALVRCWAAALVDFKYHHPSKFGPLTDAPRTARQKSLAAPLWFGPFEETKSGQAASPPPVSKSSKKRRKKKDRQQPEPSAKRVKFDAPPSPSWCPRSPEYQRSASPPHAAVPAPELAAAPAQPLAVAGPQLPTPATFAPPIPRFPAGTAPRSYPSPPPIVATDSADEVGSGTPEELLQEALWSWFNAGYQTALYHASLGAASAMRDE